MHNTSHVELFGRRSHDKEPDTDPAFDFSHACVFKHFVVLEIRPRTCLSAKIWSSTFSNKIS